jgi:hypothetical protein
VVLVDVGFSELDFQIMYAGVRALADTAARLRDEAAADDPEREVHICVLRRFNGVLRKLRRYAKQEKFQIDVS